MLRPMLTLLCALAVLGATGVPAMAATRVAEARIERIDTAVATLHQVQVRLAWAPGDDSGDLTLRAGRVEAPDLGYRYRDLEWHCPLQRGDGGAWRCEGPLRSGKGRAFHLAVAFDAQGTDATLAQGHGRLELRRRATTPDLTTIDITRVPLAWARALLAQAWPEAQLQGGTLDAKLRVRAPEGEALQVAGTVAVDGAAFDTPDASIAGQGLGGRFVVDYRAGGTRAATRFDLEGNLLGGEFLAGNAYVALPSSPVQLRLQGNKPLGADWAFPAFAWRDDTALNVAGSFALAGDSVYALDLHLRSGDLAPLRDRYLSGWLGLAGLSGLDMTGALELDVRISDGRLQQAGAVLHHVDMTDERGRFRFEGLDGTATFSANEAVDSALHWRGGQLYGLPFGEAHLPLRSGNGELRLREAVAVQAFGGSLRFEDLVLRPPAAGEGMRLHFGLALDRLDIGRLAQTLGLPAFEGELSGRIPTARYQDQRLDFDGGLAMQLFGGTVQVSSLALERPFGVAPSVTADLALDDIDLQALTGVFGFGSIAGKLDGRIAGLRLVDWTPTAFDAELHTDRQAARRAGIRQRISQRAVQDISSVGDASFAGSLQGRLIGLFDDFGYRDIGISCRLANQVCLMGGLRAAGAGFTIVEGAGLPRLTVVGYNRLVDWPTLLERLVAAGRGEVAPVVQ